jgi:probable addiction module antidote protein
MKLKDFNETFSDELRDPEYAAAYLVECLTYNEPETFLRALREIVQANSTMTAVAKSLDSSRPGLYKALSEEGNPEFKTLVAVLDAVGLQLSVTPKRELQPIA